MEDVFVHINFKFVNFGLKVMFAFVKLKVLYVRIAQLLKSYSNQKGVSISPAYQANLLLTVATVS